MEIEAPPRAQWIRTILFEMARIANITLFLGDMGVQLGAHHAGLLRLPRPRVRPQPDRGGHRRPLPPELRPHRRPQGRPAQGLDRRDQGASWSASATSATRSRTSLIGNEIFEARTRGIGVIPADVGLSYGLSGANLRASGVDWDLRRDDDVAAGVERARLEGLDPPRRRLLRPLLGAPPGDPRGHQDRRPAARRAARRADHGQGAPHHQGAGGRGLGRTPRTRSARWATTSSAKGDLGPVPGARSARPSFNNISIVPWLLRGVYVPDIITILASLYFILGDIDR